MESSKLLSLIDDSLEMTATNGEIKDLKLRKNLSHVKHFIQSYETQINSPVNSLSPVIFK